MRNPCRSIVIHVGLLALLAAALVAVTLLHAAPVQAAGVVTDCVNHSGPNGFYTKLAGGGLVTFNCAFPGPTVITIAGGNGFIPATNTTVDGTNNGHRITLSGGHTNRIVHQIVGGGTLTLKYLTLRDGNSGTEHGGCILNDATVVLLEVLITHCNTMGGFDGGAIYNSSGGTVLTQDTQIVSNTARAGGGIASLGTLQLIRTLVSDNLASIPSVTGSYGGGIYTNYLAFFVDSQIVNNHAAEWGGGIYQGFATAPSNIGQMRNTIVRGNSTQRGGGIAVFSPLSVTNTLIQGNYSETDGAGIYAQSALTLSQVTIDANRAGPGPYYGLGGGIYNNQWINGYDVTFSGNIGDSGGGLFNAPSSINGLWRFVTFRDNWVAHSGGAVFNNQGSFQVLTGTFSNNYATQYGGALYGYQGTVRLDNVTLQQNMAGIHGGGLFNVAYMSIFGAWLSGNSAVQRGGGAYNKSSLNLTNATLEGNSAAQFGGGLYHENGAASLTNATVSGNTAGLGGGGMQIEFGRADVRNVTVSDNGAPNGGGVRVFVGASLLLTNTIIANSVQGGNCTGAALASSQYSLSSDVTCNLTGWVARPNPNNVDPLLTALGNYGGLYPIHMLRAGSPAIDGVVGADAVPFDERGVPRPQGGGFDIGAVERRSGDSSLAPRLYLPAVRR